MTRQLLASTSGLTVADSGSRASMGAASDPPPPLANGLAGAPLTPSPTDLLGSAGELTAGIFEVRHR